jgi:uncharacterized SAM-binding protein YcdF (DUF218 family)
MPRINPRTSRSRGFVEPPPRRGPVMQFILFVWFLIRFVVATAIAGAFTAFAVLLWFGFTMPEAPDEPEAKVDTIVVLTGGEGRLEHGFGLLQKGLAKRLFVSGVGKASKADILKRLGDPPADLAGRIDLEFRSANTRENARETAAWFNQQNFKSMRLVTSNYHMRRSLLLFGRAMPDVRILADPYVPKGLASKPKEPGDNLWWTNPDGIKLVARELGAFLVTFFHLPIGG